ncbi:uncharacterized protein LOC135487145 [Lineus longissimus]|uniref:uncharacterized protein LOC135487145 n=1 Tax=Lineus longissimus TaxID=88925 RepID=UPI00315D0D9E
MATMKLEGPRKPQTLTKMKSDSELLTNDNILDFNLHRKVLLADHNHNLLPTDTDSEDSGAERVALPPRYKLPPGQRMNGDTGHEAREADLDVAIQWLRQEILQMKNQDRLLLRQFMSLSSTITEIKESHYVPRNMDLGSSCHSLDYWADSSMTSGGWSPMSERDILMDFQSDSVPCSPMVDRDILAEFRGQSSSPNTSVRSPIWIESGNKEEFV